MPKKRSWTDSQLKNAVKKSYSFRMVITELGLIPAGGNYVQIKASIVRLKLDTSHFTGSAWNVGHRKKQTRYGVPVEELLINGSVVQSFKLKKKLFLKGLKMPKCELCGWCKKSIDGRIPLELDHINGVRNDNRIENLRILCPNCHSLQPTHRGRNKQLLLDKKR